MNVVQECLTRAKQRYIAAPSHAPAGQWPKKGTTCAALAIIDASEDGRVEDKAINALDAVVRERGGLSIVRFNADHTTEEVVAAFDAAIEAAA